MLKLFLIAIGAYSFQAFMLLHTSPIETPKTIYYAPPGALKYFSLGYNETFADTGWLRAIQDLGLCEQDNANVTRGTGKERIPTCRKGWVYYMLDFVTDMAPRFRVPQAIGPIMLSVVVDDRAGATLLFEKAVKNFPRDWPILFRAAYHFLYEEENLIRAAELFNRAGNEGAPNWVHALAAKLYSKEGQNLIARVVLVDFLKRTPEGTPGREHIEKRLKEIDEKIAKANESTKSGPTATPNKKTK